jgi:hypothetical protein
LCYPQIYPLTSVLYPYLSTFIFIGTFLTGFDILLPNPYFFLEYV